MQNKLIITHKFGHILTLKGKNGIIILGEVCKKLKNKVNNSTDFSRRVSDYISESGYTVYKIAQLTGLGRTAIQHTMSGSLLPTKDFLEKLCSVLTITPRQKSELSELYIKEKIGAKLYGERKQLKSIIENLPQYYINHTADNIQDRYPVLSSEKAVKGILNVNQAVMSVISREMLREKPVIRTTVPFDDKLLFDFLIQIFGMYGRNVVFEHYLRIFKGSGENPDGNMHTLENVLKMSMNAGISYNPYCYYAYKNSADDDLSVFPYTLATSEYVLMISGDFQNAAISDDKGMMEVVRQHMDRIKQDSVSMTEVVGMDNMFGIFAKNSRLFEKSLEFQPCLTKYLTFDIVKRRLKDMPARDELIESLKSSFFSEEAVEITNNQIAINVFDKRGLEHFAETGVMVNLPGHLLEPLSDSEVIEILEAMKKDVGSYYLMLDETRMTVPEFIQIIYLKNQSCLISCLMEDKKFCCVINERSLSASVEDFIRSLYETGMTADNNRVIGIIDRCIDKVKNRS